MQGRTCCQHALELDINENYKPQIKDLLQRLQEKSQEIQQMNTQEQKQPVLTFNANSKPDTQVPEH